MLSIIIPAYNREDLVAETLESVRNQSRDDWECLVVDDHSTDGTEAVVRKFAERDPRFKFFRRPDSAPKGPSSCRNFGFRQSSGEYIYFFDSDDLLKRGFAESYLPYFENDPELDFLNFRLIRFDGTPEHVVRISKPKPDKMTIPEAMAGVQMTQGTQSFIWRRSCLEKESSLWREDLSHGEDHELFFRLVHQARKGLSVNEPVQVYYRRNRNGLCFLHRYDRSSLADSYALSRSKADTCSKYHDGENVQRALASFLRKQMKQALQFGSLEYLDKFYRLAEPLAAERKERLRIERYRRFSRFWIGVYRPQFLLSGLFVRFAAKAGAFFIAKRTVRDEAD